MKFKPVSLYCDCGGRLPGRIRQVGFTEQHQLVIRWWCPECKRTHDKVLTVSGGGSPEPEKEIVETRCTGTLEPDARFLHSLGVRFPDDDEPGGLPAG